LGRAIEKNDPLRGEKEERGGISRSARAVYVDDESSGKPFQGEGAEPTHPHGLENKNSAKARGGRAMHEAFLRADPGHDANIFLGGGLFEREKFSRSIP